MDKPQRELSSHSGVCGVASELTDYHIQKIAELAQDQS